EGTLPTITREQMSAAILVGLHCRDSALCLVASQRQSSVQGRCEQTILTVLGASKKWVPRRGLQRACGNFDGFTFRKALESLLWVGRIKDAEGSRSNQVVYQLAEKGG